MAATTALDAALKTATTDKVSIPQGAWAAAVAPAAPTAQTVVAVFPAPYMAASAKRLAARRLVGSVSASHIGSTDTTWRSPGE
jgi:hypothetical protein